MPRWSGWLPRARRRRARPELPPTAVRWFARKHNAASQDHAYAPSPYAVLDTESLRRAALEKSQRRSRSVARRRLLWRWLAWSAPRFVLPLALCAGLAYWGWRTWLAPPPVRPDPGTLRPLTLKPETSLNSLEP